MGAKIINRGRGPEIEGTRITVYDVWDYARPGWHRDRIAALCRLSQDIQAALDYIQQHQDAVTTHYQRIRERQQQYQYAPEVAAKIAASRPRARARLTAVHAAPSEDKPKRRRWSRRNLQWEGEFEYFDHTGYGKLTRPVAPRSECSP